MAKTFVDTNIFVYALDKGDERKHDLARRAIDDLSLTADAVVSTQVLQEFFTIATKKLGHAPLDVKPLVAKIAQNELVEVNLFIIETAMDLSILHPLSFWDALVISAASFARCKHLLTEDLQAGITIAGVKVVNPFSP